MARRILCFGELLLRLGAPGRELLLQSPRLDVHVGGAEANVAVSLAAFGQCARFAGTVADNALGAAARAALRARGVDTSGLRMVPGRMGLYFLATGAGERPSSVVYDRAGSAFATADPAGYDWPSLLAGIDVLHVSGVTPAVSAEAAAAALSAARAARTAGALVSFDGNYRAKLWAERGEAPGATLRALLDEADIAFADHRDIAVVLGDATPGAAEGDSVGSIVAAAQRAFAAFPRLRTLATTVREQRSVDDHALGAVLVTREGTTFSAPARSLRGIVDRIGAGDAFAAGVLHGLLSDMADADALAFGLAAATLKHSVPGDFNLVDAEAVAALVRGDRLDIRR